MKEKKKLNQNTFLLLVTILLFFVMYAIGCVLFNAQGFAKTQNFLNLFISNAGLIVIGIGMTIVMTGDRPPPKSRAAEAIISEIASESDTVTASDHQVERSVSSLIHSLRTTRPNESR